MATEQEKADLINVLKHGVNRYTVHLYGYGGEIVLGSITPAQYEYWREHNLDELASDWDNELAIDDELRIFRDGSWHECDDLIHENGIEFSDLSHVIVYDEAGTEVWSSPLGTSFLDCRGVDPEGFAQDEFYVRDDTSATHVFLGQSTEKGTFFTGDFETLGLFDPQRLSFSIVDIEGWQLVNGVSYESEIIEDTGGYDTRGKGMDLKVFAVERKEQA